MALSVFAVAPSPKSQAYVRGVSPSGSVAVPVKVTANGPVPLVGVAEAVTVGGALPLTPGPTKSIQLTLNRVPEPPFGSRATKYNAPSAAAPLGICAVTSVYVCHPPVPVTAAVVISGPFAAPARTSIRPPEVAEATRNRIEVRPVRLAGLTDHQSPSSMNPMFWPPPAVSPVVSRSTPAVPPPVAPATRPVAE